MSVNMDTKLIQLLFDLTRSAKFTISNMGLFNGINILSTWPQLSKITFGATISLNALTFKCKLYKHSYPSCNLHLIHLRQSLLSNTNSEYFGTEFPLLLYLWKLNEIREKYLNDFSKQENSKSQK